MDLYASNIGYMLIQTSNINNRLMPQPTHWGDGVCLLRTCLFWTTNCRVFLEKISATIPRANCSWWVPTLSSKTHGGILGPLHGWRIRMPVLLAFRQQPCGEPPRYRFHQQFIDDVLDDGILCKRKLVTGLSIRASSVLYLFNLEYNISGHWKIMLSFMMISLLMVNRCLCAMANHSPPEQPL